MLSPRSSLSPNDLEDHFLAVDTDVDLTAPVVGVHHRLGLLLPGDRIGTAEFHAPEKKDGNILYP